MSLKKGSGSPSADLKDVPGLSILEAQFIAGVLDHLQAVAAFVMPTMFSYERLVDGAWAVLTPEKHSKRQGGTHICWGIENREAPVRACPYGDGKEYNFEIKCIDGTANPYLALAAILAAGMIGVKNPYTPAMKPCQGTSRRCGG